MEKNQNTEHRQSTPVSTPETSNNEQDPHIVWKYKTNELSGKEEFEKIELSNGEKWNPQNLTAAIKRATGTSNISAGEAILQNVANGFSYVRPQKRMNEASVLLPSMQPQDATEGLLCGQFLALQNSAMECLRLAHLPEQGFYHEERFLNLAHKLFNTANQTMQTLMKYRTRGNVTMQVVHVHNQQGKAIVTQNLTSKNAQEG